ncbi:hypothetical protein ACIRCZ_10980 [Leifsonia sp. NPDC102414]|uniref:hypothetical protein n=1 Tax=Leifsonia sp. NPDC102414 TaxID=3364124 RepID=UPI00380792AE
MSDTSGLPNTDSNGVPAEEDPTRFESGSGADAADRDAQAKEPAETEDPGVSGAADTGAQAEPDPTTGTAASTGTDAAEPPPAELDPAQNPSNPDLVDTTEAPD